MRDVIVGRWWGGEAGRGHYANISDIYIVHTKDYFLFGQFHGMTSVLGIAAPRSTHLSTVHSVSTIFNFIHLISAMAMHIVDFGLANARSKGQAERHERRQQGQLMKRQQYNKWKET